MTVSVIIPTFNTRDLTIACLSAIQRYPPPGSYEVIVVDNNSSDQTYEEVKRRFPEVIALRNASNVGFGRACNQGAKAAHGDFLLFLNSDTEPLENSFSNLLDWMKSHPQTGIVGPEFIGPNQKLLQMSWSWNPLLGGEVINRYFSPQNLGLSKLKQHWIRSFQDKPREVPFICGACLMIRRDVFDQLHGFDESFELYFEDADLCLRCSEGGWRVDFVPDSKIVHYIGQSSKGTWTASSLIYQQSHLTYYRKHGPAWSIYFLKAHLLFKWLRLRLRALLTRQDRARAQIFCRSFLSIIFESLHFTVAAPFDAQALNGNGVRKLNLGCGHEILPGWINLDAAALPGVDVVHDIEKTPWPFERDSVDQISAHQILEHVEYIPVLREAHKILRRGGIFEIIVPHFTSRNNWIDPTHKKTFSIRTFEFFIERSRFKREYYFDFAFSRIRRQRIVFEKGWLAYNYLIELLVNLHPKIAVIYEATFLRSLFPAESVMVELEK
jgi:GT2 family glycosyltransferase